MFLVPASHPRILLYIHSRNEAKVAIEPGTHSVISLIGKFCRIFDCYNCFAHYWQDYSLVGC
jgi:hypothetical protein